jgi:uncharacterized protein with HEPN domain
MNLINKDLICLERVLAEVLKIEQATTAANTPTMFPEYLHLFDDVVVKNFIIIGELFNKLSDEFKTQYCHLPYQEIRGLRNMAVHQYHKIDMTRIWKIATDDIPILKAQIIKIINEIS